MFSRQKTKATEWMQSNNDNKNYPVVRLSACLNWATIMRPQILEWLAFIPLVPSLWATQGGREAFWNNIVIVYILMQSVVSNQDR
jgi:hypothetical protein